MPDRKFDPAEFLPADLFAKVTEDRIEDPGRPSRVASTRRRRRKLAPDGRLTLLAADHPARMVTGIREDPLRMARRREFLSRILRATACSPLDGVLGTADVIDDLLVLERHCSLGNFLDGKLIIGSVNRGGIAGSSFELDDRVTGYDVDGIVSMRLDGAKFLLRVDLEDPLSLKAVRYCVETIRECQAKKVPMFLEPLPVVKKDGKYRTDNAKEKLIKLVGFASALGSSTARVWLKLPYCSGFEEVAGATTFPILLLGGEASDDVRGLLEEVESAMKSGPNVRGVLMGRNLLYPPGDDPLPLAFAVNSVVHKGVAAKEAAERMKDWSGRDLDVFSSND